MHTDEGKDTCIQGNSYLDPQRCNLRKAELETAEGPLQDDYIEQDPYCLQKWPDQYLPLHESLELELL